MRFFFYKLFRFEYWPWKVFYAPLVPYYLFLSLKNKSLIFPSLVNISLHNGGFFSENKEEILQNLPKQYLPNSVKISEKEKLEGIIDKLKANNLEFPVVAKPLDLQRGKFVSIVQNQNELSEYISRFDKQFLIQEFITLPVELAVLYSRLPNQKHGVVSSVTQKEFLSVIGDGKSSLEDLLKSNPRAQMIWNDILNNTKINPTQILPLGEKLIIEKIGNHCRGTLFRDARNFDKEKIASVIDEILKDFEGFYYGRFDMKIASEEELYKGKNIRILELNGVNADAAHIFDPDYSLFKAYQDVAWHWKRLSDIALYNKAFVKKSLPFKTVFNKLNNS